MAFPGSGGGGDFEIIGKIVIDDQGMATITGLKSGLSGLQGSADATAGSFSNFGAVVDFALGTLAAHAVENLIGWIGQMSSAWLESATAAEKTLASLNQTLISTHDASGLTAQGAMALATQFRDLAGGQNEAVLSAEKVLARFTNISGATFPTALKATLDLAAAMGMDAASAAQQLGRMLEEPGLGAQRLATTLGFQLLPAQKKAIEAMTLMGDVAGAQRILLDLLAEHTGGQAAAAADTLGGKWAILAGHAHDFGEELGTHLLPFLERLLDVVTPMLDQFYQAFETTFVPLIDQAGAWGEAIVNTLAQGMQAAFGAVEAVINELGSLIGSLLAPGSPPKFLPLLDVWGREAVDVYLKGWTTFDKSVFDEIGKAIKAGLPSAEIMQYAGVMHQLYDANQAVADAQDNLNAVTAHYDELLMPLNEKLKGLENQQQAAKDQMDIAALQNVAHSSFYSASQQKQALLEIEKIKTREQIDAIDLQKMTAVDHAKVVLTAAQQRQKDLAEESRLLKDQIDIQAEQTQHINQTTAAVHALHGALASLAGLGLGGGGAGKGSPLVTDMENLKAAITGKADEIQAKVQGFVGGLQSLMRQVADIFRPIAEGLEYAKRQFDLVLPQMQLAWASMWQFLQTEIALMSPGIRADIRTMAEDIKTIIEGLARFWKEHFATISAANVSLWAFVIALAAASITFLAGAVTIGLDLLALDWSQAGTDIVNTGITMWNELLALFGTNLNLLVTRFLVGVIQLGVNLKLIFDNILITLNLLKSEFFALATNLLSGLVSGAESMAQRLIDSILGPIKSAIGQAKALLGISSPSSVFADIGKDMMAGMTLGIIMGANGPASAVSHAVNNISSNSSHVTNVNMAQNIYGANINGGLGQNYSLLRARVGV